MRRRIGETAVSASGGTTRLVGHVGGERLTLGDAALALSLLDVPRADYGPSAYGELAARGGEAPWLAPGEVVALHTGHHHEMARVVSDDARGLLAVVAPGSGRVCRVRADGGHLRSVGLAERFDGLHRWAEGTWRGPATLRWYPPSSPWSVWWFRDAAGGFAGWYVNLELPQRREHPAEGPARLHSRDLTLDLWLEADDDGGVGDICAGGCPPARAARGGATLEWDGSSRPSTRGARHGRHPRHRHQHRHPNRHPH